MPILTAVYIYLNLEDETFHVHQVSEYVCMKYIMTAIFKSKFVFFCYTVWLC